MSENSEVHYVRIHEPGVVTPMSPSWDCDGLGYERLDPKALALHDDEVFIVACDCEIAFLSDSI